MQFRYDENAREKNFKPGDKEFALLPIPGRYTVHKKISDVNCIINTPGRRKQKQLRHINMLKEYVVTSVNVVNSVPHEQCQMDSEYMNVVKSDPLSSTLQNFDILKDLDQKLLHLDLVNGNDLKQLIHN